ncbi:MAG: alpha-amylase family protein [Armatimonadota bacterium]
MKGNTFINDILRQPDSMSVWSNGNRCLLDGDGQDRFSTHGIEVSLKLAQNSLGIDLTAPDTAVEIIQLRWAGEFGPGTRFLGDHWERGYGDFEWRGIVPERIMPWYFLAYDGKRTSGYGVKTGASAMCYWQTDSSGISLFLDVRSGGSGVILGQRTLRAADVVCRKGSDDETPFQAARAFCVQMCSSPRLPDHQVYGSNNWYYAYGKSSHAEILRDTEILVSHAPNVPNRPYMVIDAGWALDAFVTSETNNSCTGGPWDQGNDLFPDMPGLASSIKEMGARPGIWMRPLAVDAKYDKSLLLPDSRMQDVRYAVPIMDPSIKENIAKVQDDIRRLVDWGYTLIKHDFSTYDIFGHWGFEMGNSLTKPGWSFADRSRTTAEIIRDLYTAIRTGAGEALIIGCNTVGHIGAGLFEIQRTGDDTSGQEWERTRKMGVNTLAFRMPQHRLFYESDADCVGLTNHVPWELNSQWLDVLAKSGTPLFVSASPDAIGPEQSAALKDAFAKGAEIQPIAEPLDWLDTTCPRIWRQGSEISKYDW